MTPCQHNPKTKGSTVVVRPFTAIPVTGDCQMFCSNCHVTVVAANERQARSYWAKWVYPVSSKAILVTLGNTSGVE